MKKVLIVILILSLLGISGCSKGDDKTSVDTSSEKIETQVDIQETKSYILEEVESAINKNNYNEIINILDQNINNMNGQEESEIFNLIMKYVDENPIDELKKGIFVTITNDEIYGRKKINGMDKLMKYERNGNKKELYTEAYFEYSVSPNKVNIAINNEDSIIIMDVNGKIVDLIKRKISTFKWVDDIKIQCIDSQGQHLKYRLGQEVKENEGVLIGDNSQNEYHPVVFSFKNRDGVFSKAYILGGSKGGKWYSVYDFNMPKNYIEEDYVDTLLARGREEYLFYYKNEKIGSLVGDSPKLSISQSCGESIVSIGIPTIIENRSDFLLGINANWNPIPRYIEEVQKDKYYIVDIDKDGVKEKVFVEETIINPREKKINLYIEKNNVTQLVENITIDDVYLSEYGFYILDINGDSTYEIISVARGHNVEIKAYELKNNTIRQALSFYDGD